VKLLLRLSLLSLLLAPVAGVAGQLQAGVAKVEITDRTVPVNDPLFAKTLVLRSDDTTVAIITVDAVAIGEIGRIKNDFLVNVRAQLQKELNIPPAHVLINASHCHGIVCADVERRTVQVVKDACRNFVPVKVGAGRGHEDRISENRRLKLKDGTETDVRHAYSTAPDEEIVGAGPIDPEIGLLRLDSLHGKPFAVVYNFAVHPIQGVPNRGNTADITGFASKTIEDGLGAFAIFLQGCCGDINPVRYKDVHNSRDAEPLGKTLGLSALQALKKIRTRENNDLRVINEVLALPRATDFERRIAALQAEQTKLFQSLRGTSLNLKTFTELFPQYKEGKLDAENRAKVESYIRNVHTMEKVTRLQVNLDLLKKHQARNTAAKSATVDVEIMGVRIGDFVLLTFPGELTVEVGLNIKKRAPAPFTFVAGYTNGYIYYAPTAERRNNKGYAQEDCDCLLAPEWQELFEDKVAAILKKL